MIVPVLGVLALAYLLARAKSGDTPAPGPAPGPAPVPHGGEVEVVNYDNPPKPRPKPQPAPKPKPDAEHSGSLVIVPVDVVDDAKPKPAPSPSNPKAAAQSLFDYAQRLYVTGKQAELSRVNEKVRSFQKGMGGVAVDGKYGEKTRARGNVLLGKAFPSQAGFALDLLSYVDRAISKGELAKLGSSQAPSDPVKVAQRAMGELVADGVYGTKTEQRGEKLTGKKFPSRPRPAPAPAPRPRPAPAPAPSPRPRPAPAPSPRPRPAPAPAPSPQPAKRTAKEAAQALLDHVLLNPNPKGYGHKNNPNAVVAAAQADMGLAADGIYGPAARTRGKELLGKTFPARR